MGSEITDDTVEPLAFAVCNTDGVEGLSWVEVEQCEVSKSKYCISANQCPQKLFFFEFGDPKVTVHKAKGQGTYMCKNYSREETIQGWKLYEEIRYTYG